MPLCYNIFKEAECDCDMLTGRLPGEASIKYKSKTPPARAVQFVGNSSFVVYWPPMCMHCISPVTRWCCWLALFSWCRLHLARYESILFTCLLLPEHGHSCSCKVGQRSLDEFCAFRVSEIIWFTFGIESTTFSLFFNCKTAELTIILVSYCSLVSKHLPKSGKSGMLKWWALKKKHTQHTSITWSWWWRQTVYGYDSAAVFCK